MALHRNAAYVNPIAELVQPVCDALIRKEVERLDGILAQLVKENYALGGAKEGYVHCGRIFSDLPPRERRGAHFRPVMMGLRAQADDLLMLTQKLENDAQMLRQSLSVVLSKCLNLQEARDVLPENLVNLIPAFRGLERHRDEGFILDQFPLLKSQYNKAVEIALYYQVNQLIF